MVKSLRFLVSAALAVLAVDASAITENFGVLTSTPSVAFITYDVPGAIDDFFEFSIPLANVDAYAEEFGARSVNITGGEFTLFSGACPQALRARKSASRSRSPIRPTKRSTRPCPRATTISK